MTGETANGARVFRLDPRAHAAVMRRRLVWMLLFMAVVLAAFQLFYWYLQRGRPDAQSLETSLVVGAALLILMTVMTVSSARKAVASFRLRLEPDAITVETAGLLQQRIARAGVRRVRERAGGLEIVPARGLPIGVASSLEGYAEVKAELMTWAPVPVEGPGQPRPMIMAVIGMVAVLATCVLSPLSGLAKTPAVSFALAILAAAAATYCWWYFGLLPFRQRALIRGYFVLAGAGVILLNVLRWTLLRP
jgi:hypothetical protein